MPRRDFWVRIPRSELVSQNALPFSFFFMPPHLPFSPAFPPQHTPPLSSVCGSDQLVSTVSDTFQWCGYTLIHCEITGPTRVIMINRFLNLTAKRKFADEEMEIHGWLLFSDLPCCLPGGPRGRTEVSLSLNRKPFKLCHPFPRLLFFLLSGYNQTNKHSSLHCIC